MRCSAWPFRVISGVTVLLIKGLGSSTEDKEGFGVRILVTPCGTVMVSLDPLGDCVLNCKQGL